MNGLSPIRGIHHTFHATLLPQILKNSGYQTIHAGKSHLGAIGTPGEFPENIGFDVNIAGHAAGGLASYFGKDNFGNKGEHSSVWLFLDWRNIMVRIFTLLKQSPKRHCLFWTR